MPAPECDGVLYVQRCSAMSVRSQPTKKPKKTRKAKVHVASAMQ